MYYILTAIVAAALALAIYILIKRSTLKGQSEAIIEKARIEAENIKNEKIFQAKEKFLQLKADHEKHVNEKNAQIRETEQRLKQKENTLKQFFSDDIKKQCRHSQDVLFTVISAF